MKTSTYKPTWAEVKASIEHKIVGLKSINCEPAYIYELEHAIKAVNQEDGHALEFAKALDKEGDKQSAFLIRHFYKKLQTSKVS